MILTLMSFYIRQLTNANAPNLFKCTSLCYSSYIACLWMPTISVNIQISRFIGILNRTDILTQASK